MAMPALPDLAAFGPYLPAAALAGFPDDGNRYEVVYGELLVSPSPSNRHQGVLEALSLALGTYGRQAGSAAVRYAPLRIEVGPDTAVEPDLIVIPQALAGQVERYRLDQLLLVAEVLSPSTARADRFAKRRLYQEAGIPTYWIVDHEAACVEVWAPGARFPVVVRDRLTWQAPGAAEPVVLELAALFTLA